MPNDEGAGTQHSVVGCLQPMTSNTVLEKCPPGLRWRSTTPDHVLGDRGLGDLDPKLQQLAMDPRGAPRPVDPAHAPDQVTDLRIDLATVEKGNSINRDEYSGGTGDFKGNRRFREAVPHSDPSLSPILCGLLRTLARVFVADRPPRDRCQR